MSVTVAGIYDGLDENEYHADPIEGGSLSVSEARRVLDCPAKYRWFKDNGQEFKDVFDFGKAAHGLVLGCGGEVVICEFDDWRTKDARAARDEARADGKTPMLTKDYSTVQAMAEALKAHPIAMRLFKTGLPEQSMFWQDRDPFTDRSVWLRGRLDWLPPVPTSGRLIVPDYKTAASAESHAFARSAASYGYHQQAAWYLDGLRTLLGVDDPAFVFVVQEKEPPYVVNVIELDTYALDIGRARNCEAIARWIACTDAGTWPGYSDEVELVALPRWAEIQHEEQAA